MRHGCLFLAVCAAMVLASTASGQGTKPGPEHEMLKEMEGTWEATMKVGDMESKGTMTYKMDLGGLWLLSDYEGSFGDMKFKGHGIDGYDPMKKKYVTLWVDSMMPRPIIAEGTYDKDTKTMTMTTKGPGEDGKIVDQKMVTTMKDKDTMTFTMSIVGKDGKDTEMFTIHYKRKK
jgi:hypothetical protein